MGGKPKSPSKQLLKPLFYLAWQAIFSPGEGPVKAPLKLPPGRLYFFLAMAAKKKTLSF